MHPFPLTQTYSIAFQIQKIRQMNVVAAAAVVTGDYNTNI